MKKIEELELRDLFRIRDAQELLKEYEYHDTILLDDVNKELDKRAEQQRKATSDFLEAMISGITGRYRDRLKDKEEDK